ncbi:MAG: fimbrial biogenesis outer membrane usher protein [Bdellovibrionales bacterium]|nr:fimbrial biogenesis outer membrane usher protein [Oligoflexia bacterium]
MKFFYPGLFLLQCLGLFLETTAFAQYESQEITLGVYNHSEYLCEAWVNVGKLQSLAVKIKSTSLLNCLKEKLTEDAYEKLNETWKDQAYIEPVDAGLGQLKSKVSLEYYRIDLVIPGNWLKPIPISMRAEEESTKYDEKPAIFSSYLNYSFNKTFGGPEISAPILLLNPVAGFNGTILESYHQVNQGGGLQRLETRLTHDFEHSLTRGILGDQYTKQTPLMSPIRIAGLTVNRQFDISPGFVNRPLGSREIFLEQPSRVDIFINGILFRTLNLQPGRQLLEDIPVNQGINNVTLRITDQNGQSRLIQFQSSTEENSLRKGVSDYSFQGGMITQTAIDNSLQYKSTAAYSAYYRKGISDTWTAGAFSQGTSGAFLGGIEQTFAEPIGIFHMEAAGSQASQGPGCALRLEYAWSCPCSFGGRGSRFAIGGGWYSPNFLLSTVPVQLASNRNRWTLYPSYSFSFGSGFAAQVRGGMDQRFDQVSRSLTMAANVNKTISQDFFVSAGYSREYLVNQPILHSINIQAVLQLENGHKTLSNLTNFTSVENLERVDGYYNQKKQTNNLIAQAYAENVSGSQGGGLLLGYASQYADLNGGLNYTRTSLSRSDQSPFALTLNPTGSIAFADGVFGIGRPIRDSFIIVKNDHDQSVLVNGPEDYEARIPPRWSGVLTNTQAYRRKVIGITDQTTDVYGYSLNQSFNFRPTYKTGTLVRVAHEEIYGVSGVLHASDGKVAKLAAGRLVGLESKKEISFFTDYDGKFLLEQITPDNYSLSVFNFPFEDLSLDLTTLHDRMTELGDINLKRIVNVGPK